MFLWRGVEKAVVSLRQLVPTLDPAVPGVRGPVRVVGGITISSNSWGLADIKHVRKPRCNGGLEEKTCRAQNGQDPTN